MSPRILRSSMASNDGCLSGTSGNATASAPAGKIDIRNAIARILDHAFGMGYIVSQRMVARVCP